MDKIKEFAKYLIFMELLSLVIIVVVHIVLYIAGDHTPSYWHIYWVAPSVICAAMVFGEYVIEPLAKWYFKLWDK